MIKTVIFDFNGTLFIDHDINRIAWIKTLKEITKDKINVEEFYNPRASMHNYLIVKDAYNAINDPQNDEVLNWWAKHKEEYYQEYCIVNNRNQMTKGAPELLDYLKEKGIKIGLCTSSLIENVNFYYKNVNLYRWFNMEYTVYDNGSYTNKTQMYKDCAKKLGSDISEALVFEDSPSAIKDVIEAGCKNVVAIKRNDTPYIYKEVKQIINDFTEFDRTII